VFIGLVVEYGTGLVIIDRARVRRSPGLMLSTLNRLLTYCMRKPTQPFIFMEDLECLSGSWNDYWLQIGSKFSLRLSRPKEWLP